MRFTDSLLQKKVNSKNYLTVPELKRSEDYLIKISQRITFSSELDALSKKVPLPRCSRILSLNPFLDEEGILRVGGRIRQADIPFGARHQSIIAKGTHLGKLLANYEHKLFPGAGPEAVISSLRQRYWIIGARLLVKKTLKQCMECRKRLSKPRIPIMADLPECRLAMNSPCFYFTGVDFFGPLQIKQGRAHHKRWGCLFTCMSTRAVHLEVSESLDTSSFLNTLERFINRRGHPKTILSDCGSNFKGADKELKKCLQELKQDAIGEYAARKEIEWKFNPPDAPHMGGAWERLIRSVKQSMKVVLKERCVTDFELNTIFSAVEGIVNSRPLTPVSDNSADFEALTPNHLLLGRPNLSLSPNVVYKTDMTSSNRWKHVQFMISNFWRRWRKEYLSRLSQRSKWTGGCDNLKIGDIVQITDKNISRGR